MPTGFRPKHDHSFDADVETPGDFAEVLGNVSRVQFVPEGEHRCGGSRGRCRDERLRDCLPNPFGSCGHDVEERCCRRAVDGDIAP
jgi:hypothetical protein